MAFLNFIETFFILSLGITFILILLLVYHFKQRIVSIEQKNETMFEIVNNIVSEINILRNNINGLKLVPMQMNKHIDMSFTNENTIKLSETFQQNNEHDILLQFDNEYDTPINQYDDNESDDDDDDNESDDDDNDDDNESDDDDDDNDNGDDDKNNQENDDNDIIINQDSEVIQESPIKIISINPDTQIEDNTITRPIVDISSSSPVVFLSLDSNNIPIIDPSSIDNNRNIMVNLEKDLNNLTNIDEFHTIHQTDESIDIVQHSHKDVYKKMNLQTLKTTVILKGLCSDPSKMKKADLLKLLENL